MAAIHSDEFKRDAVRIGLTSGLMRRQVTSDLGVGHSTLGKWVRAVSEEAKVPAQDVELLRGNERLRKENRILREEREVLKRWRCSSRLKSHEVSVYCRVSRCADPRPSVPHVGRVRTRAACLEAPAPVASPAARHGALGPYSRPAPVSLGSYGRPRMTGELNELGIRVGRLMRQNGIQIIRSRKFKRTTDSDHTFNIAPNLLQQDFTAGGPNQKWPYGGASPAYRLTGRRHRPCLNAGGVSLSGRDH